MIKKWVAHFFVFYISLYLYLRIKYNLRYSFRKNCMNINLNILIQKWIKIIAQTANIYNNFSFVHETKLEESWDNIR